MTGYTKVFERDKKKFVSSWKHVRISIYKMTTDMKNVILQRQDWMRTSKHVRQKIIDCIDRRHGATGENGSRTRGNWVVE